MSDSWRNDVLNKFVPELARLTLVADPDDLLSDEGMQDALEVRGFEVVKFEDPISFRYLYESTYRSRWVAGESFELVIVLQADRSALENLPYDLLKGGRQLSLSLADLFLGLTYREVAALAQRDLATLYETQKMQKPGNLGENGTKDFILQHVYGISAAMIKNEADLLTILLRLHLSGKELPVLFCQRLSQQLGREAAFAEWPIEHLLSDSAALYEFLQERWPLYLRAEVTKDETTLHDLLAQSTYDFKWQGPQLLPFGQSEIRAFVDTLFLEGKLQPVTFPKANELKERWVTIGIHQDTVEDTEEHLARLLQQLQDQVPQDSANYQDWLRFTPAWSEAVVLRHLPKANLSMPVKEDFASVQATIDNVFHNWLSDRYRYLDTLSPHPPVMVDHIARSLSRQVNRSTREKAALIVVDGLAYDQWLIMGELLREQLPKVRVREHAVFAWLPTLTSVSRQSIFAGKAPLFFPESISRTAKEPALWSLFWEDAGLSTPEIGYEKTLRRTADLERVEQLVTTPKMRMVGLVVDQVDTMMHGIKLGLPGLHQQLRLWMGSGFLAKLLTLLFEHEYQVFITSDHGNIAAEGIGNPREQSLADVRGARARIYPNETLRTLVLEGFPEAIAWPTDGLPTDYYPLLAPKRKAFVQAGQWIVSHGGLSLEEVVVPYIEIERKVM